MGSAIRRFRQWRSGSNRSVHQLRRTEMGPSQRPDAAAAAWLRRQRARTFLGPAGTLFTAVRPAQHAGLRAEHARPGLPYAAPPGLAPLARALDRDDAEKPVAPQTGG